MASAKSIQVQCPSCNAVLQISESLRGERVVCERCGGKLKVPGLSSSATAEDDWLKLDTESEAVRSVAQAAPSPDPAGDDGGADEFILPETPQPLPPATPRPLSATKPRSGMTPPSLSEADLELLAGFGGEPPANPNRAKLVAVKTPTDGRFRVRCPVCESMNYATIDQIGKRIRCGDCDSPITVPPPPKPKQTYQPDIESAQVFKFSDGDEEQTSSARPTDPFRRSADDYLRAAEKAEDEVDEPEWELPSFGSWFTRLGKVFLDPAVGLHIGLLSLFAFVPTYILLNLDHEARIVMMGMFAMALVFTALVVACGFAILQSVANGEEKVSEWPVFDPMEWLGQIFVAICATAVAAGPIALLAHFFSPGGLATVALAMFSLYLLYPIVLMSMLDEQSVFVPFSADVSKSVMRAPDQWGAAYLASAGLFAVMFFAYLFATICSAVVGAAIVIFVTIAGIFFYFGILGQLAYGIGQAINAPPMINDIDRSKKNDDEIAPR